MIVSKLQKIRPGAPVKIANKAAGGKPAAKKPAAKQQPARTSGAE